MAIRTKIKAIWNDQIIAESSDFVLVGGVYYFPIRSLNRSFFSNSDHKTECPNKGVASYFDVIVNGQLNKNAAWYYATPKAKFKYIKKYVGFWNGVQVIFNELNAIHIGHIDVTDD